MQTSWQKVSELAQEYRSAELHYWLNETLFTPIWWILFVTTLGTLIVWFLILDKKRITEILTFGLLVSIVSLLLDALGLALNWWEYKHMLTPLSLPIEIHVVQMPVIYMIIYQYFHTWKTFIIANMVNAFVFAFILEPLLVWLQVYDVYKWEHVYSFFPYIIIALVFKYAGNQFKKWEQH